MLKKLSAACALAFAATTPAGAATLGLGDSNMFGYCIPTVNQRTVNVVANTLNDNPVTNLGSDGYQTNTVISRELPLITSSGYDDTIIMTGLNDMNNLFKAKQKPGYVPPMSNYITSMEQLLQDVRTLEPNSVISVVGVWDIAYLDTEDHYTAAQRAAFEAQIGQYDAAVQAYIQTQPGMFYVPRFPEATFPQYYTKANVCNDLHPTAAGDLLMATQIIDGVRLTRSAARLRSFRF
jgi:hypothetical protein